jgi:hypothetical protein
MLGVEDVSSLGIKGLVSNAWQHSFSSRLATSCLSSFLNQRFGGCSSCLTCCKGLQGNLFHRRSARFSLGLARKLKQLRGVSLLSYGVHTISTCLGEVFRMPYVTIICLTLFDIITLCPPKIILYTLRSNQHCHKDILLRSRLLL